jgi:pyruvate formate lyase activating enzyme
MSSGIIFDIRRYSIHDGPGIRTAVFFKGCPLACRWCHNPEGISYQPELIFRRSLCILCDDCIGICPEKAISRIADEIKINRDRCTTRGNCISVCMAEALEVVGHSIATEYLLEELECDQPFYEQSGGGVTFTGGEPLAQEEFLFEVLFGCRARGLHTAVDTSGYAPWLAFEKIAPLVDVFLYDLKLMEEKRHYCWTGVSNADILSNLQRLSEGGKKIIVRIPIIPSVNDDQENLFAAASFITSLPNHPMVELLHYHKNAEIKYTGLGKKYPLPDLVVPSSEKMQGHKDLFRSFGLQVL